MIIIAQLSNDQGDFLNDPHVTLDYSYITKGRTINHIRDNGGPIIMSARVINDHIIEDLSRIEILNILDDRDRSINIMDILPTEISDKYYGFIDVDDNLYISEKILEGSDDTFNDILDRNFEKI